MGRTDIGEATSAAPSPQWKSSDSGVYGCPYASSLHGGRCSALFLEAPAAEPPPQETGCLRCGHGPGYHEATLREASPCHVKDCTCHDYVCISFYDALRKRAARSAAPSPAPQKLEAFLKAKGIERRHGAVTVVDGSHSSSFMDGYLYAMAEVFDVLEGRVPSPAEGD